MALAFGDREWDGVWSLEKMEYPHGFLDKKHFWGKAEGKNIGIHDREILSFASIITDICCYSACAL